MRFRAAACITLACASAFVPPEAEAFLFIRGGSYGKGERPVSAGPVWPSRVVRFYVNTDMEAYGGSEQPEVTGSEFLTAVEDAVNAWAVSCRADIRVEVAGTTTLLDDPDDRRNVIVYDNRTDAELNQFQDTAILAAATSVLQGDNFYDCDIAVNGYSQGVFRTGTTPSPGEIDLRSVLTHEIGHCLGLDHPVEPGNYDSTNAYLYSATMVQSVVVQEHSTVRRDLNQDDLDAIDCLYERGLPFRTGTSCSSYHGTNSRGPVGTDVTGGATSTRAPVCGSIGDARTVLPNEEKRGVGCVGNAIGSTDFHDVSTAGGWVERLSGPFLWVSILLLFRLLTLLGRRGWRRITFFLLFFAYSALSLRSPAARADGKALTFSLGHQRMNSASWDRFTTMDTQQGVWDAGPFQGKQDGFFLLQGQYGFVRSPQTTFAGSLSLVVPNSVKSQGTPQGQGEITKTSSFWGARVGPTLRHSPFEALPSFFMEGTARLGFLILNQKMQGALNGQISASALEYGAELAAGYQFFTGNSFSPFLKLGYALSSTGYFTAMNASGPAYSDFRSGDRLALRNPSGAEDLKISTTGPFLMIGVNIPIGDEPRSRSFDVNPDETDYRDEYSPAEPAAPEPQPEPEFTGSSESADPPASDAGDGSEEPADESTSPETDSADADFPETESPDWTPTPLEDIPSPMEFPRR